VCPTKYGSRLLLQGDVRQRRLAWGTANEIFNNTIIVSTNNASFEAGAIYLGGSLGVNVSHPIVFTNNRIISNSRGVLFSTPTMGQQHAIQVEHVRGG